MTTIALDYIHAAQEALDEGAIKTAKRLMDLAVQQINEQAAHASVRRRQQVQATLVTTESSSEPINAALRDWISDRVGEVITHAEACQWIDGSSGIQLTWADRQQNSNKTQIWRGHVSRCISELRDLGVLSGNHEDGSPLPRRHYLVLRKP